MQLLNYWFWIYVINNILQSEIQETDIRKQFVMSFPMRDLIWWKMQN